MKFKRALFVFRRDLRLEDNLGLLFAQENAHEVALAFIFTPDQIEKNKYLSNRCLQFMIESLEDLQDEIEARGGRLYFFYGEPDAIVSFCIETLSVDAVVVNCDYTPYSQKRDQKIAIVCKKKGSVFFSFEDALLAPLGQTLKIDNTPYTVFTPYFRRVSSIQVACPISNPYMNFYTKRIAHAPGKKLFEKILPLRMNQQKGGRKEALTILKKIGDFSDYPKQKELFFGKTTHLAPHLKFTTCSPREAYHAIRCTFGASSELIRSLVWRDFFSQIAFFYPKIFAGPFYRKFEKLRWKDDKKAFKKWCEGKTGVPIVDAAMRELNETGFLSNRSRMVVASFLVKDLHINWRWGEKYFAEHLIDYDPAVNNGNWQWVASTGAVSQKYYTVFNPWTQAKRFDKEAVYIKRWVKELGAFDAKTIHNLASGQVAHYPSPLIDHAHEALWTIQEYKRVISSKRLEPR